MNKKLLALIIATSLAATSVFSAFAEYETEENEMLYQAADSDLYELFANASLKELRTLFINNRDSFSFWQNKGGRSYTDSDQSVIILEAWQKGFDSFAELDDNVSEAAENLVKLKSNPSLYGLSGYSNVTVDWNKKETSTDDVFKFDNKEFIVLDAEEVEDGEMAFFLMTKDYYGSAAVDPTPGGRWDDNKSNNLPYKLTNQMAFGNYPSYNIPEKILENMDMLHEWNIEPGSFSGFENEHTVIGPISAISVTEYKKYGEKIGIDSNSTNGFYWTRTPVQGSAEFEFTINFQKPEVLNKNKGWGSSVTYLRPVLYLRTSFFTAEKMQKCGENVKDMLFRIVGEDTLRNLYTADEFAEVFGEIEPTPTPIPTPTVNPDEQLYELFKSAKLQTLRSLFMNNKESFEFWKNKGDRQYTDSELSVIILEAYQKGFESFSELNENVTIAAQKLNEIKDNPKLLGLNGYSGVNVPWIAKETDNANVFKVDGKEFIVLDEVQDNDGNPMFYVMARDYYGSTAVDPTPGGRWDDTKSNNLPYKLTNQMAFGNYSGYNIPDSLLKNMDMLHEWNIEPGSYEGFKEEHVVVAPISAISITEYLKYGEKIGSDPNAQSGYYWTRTPVLGSAEFEFAVNTVIPQNINSNKGWGSTITYLRPVFYLHSDFFKTEKMQKCGENITVMLDSILTQQELQELYSTDELSDVFGELSIEPDAPEGKAIVGNTIKANYKYNGNIPLKSVDIKWERTTDKNKWSEIDGAKGEEYKLTTADKDCYIRAVFTPVFESVILKNGKIVYAECNDKVYTEEQLENVIKALNDAQTAEQVKAVFESNSALFHCDFEKDGFSDAAAEIFAKDTVKSIDEAITLYNKSIALSEFCEANDESIKEIAENSYLLGGIEEYAQLNDMGKKWVINELKKLSEDKKAVSKFEIKENSYVMLAGFNNCTKDNVVSLLSHYKNVLNCGIEKLNDYQLKTVGSYIFGNNFGTDEQTLKNAVRDAVNKVMDAPVVKPPSVGGGGSGSGGASSPLPIRPIQEIKTQDKNITDNTITDTYFNDLSGFEWAVDAINNLVEKGVINGTGNNCFEPSRAVSRSEFVKMIASAFDIKSDKELSFDDVKPEDWCYKYVAAASNAGIIFGVSDNYFGGENKIKREDAAVISARVLKYLGIELENGENIFNDEIEIADYAKPYVLQICKAGIMKGTENSNFEPKETTNRAMAAVIIERIMKLAGEEQ